MKKILLCLICLILPVFIFAKSEPSYDLNYNAPELPTAESVLVDLFNYKSQSITSSRIVYNSNGKSIIQIYGNNPVNQKWEPVGKSDLKGFSDKDSATFSNKDCKNWRYFAIVPDAVSDFIYQIKVSGKTLHIEVRDEGDNFNLHARPKFTNGNAEVFDIDEYGAEDYLVIHNLTKNEKLRCIPYYFDDHDCDWKRGCEDASLRSYNDTCKIEIIDDEGVEDLDYIALEITPSGNYKFKVYEKNNDLWIAIME